jgi:hypothetical protein
MPSGAQGGKPTYVCGQNNDGYMRWWPTNAIGPPIGVWYWQGSLNLANVQAGQFLNVAQSANPNSLAHVSGNSIVVDKSGWYYVYAWAQSNSQVFADGKNWRVRIFVNGGDQSRTTADTGLVNGNNGGGVSRCSASAFLFIGAGSSVQIWSSQDSAGAWTVVCNGGYVELAFVPTADYNN